MNPSSPAMKETMAGLICAFQLDGKGGGTPLGWEQIHAHEAKNGIMWVHLDYLAEDTRVWLRDGSGIDEVTCEALLADDPRPRCVETKDGLMLILRGVNLNEGAEPEDMVSMRVWIDRQRLVTLRHRRNNAAKEMRQAITGGKGPRNLSECVVELLQRLVDAIAVVSDQVDDTVAELETGVTGANLNELRHQLAEMRRRAIGLRRYVAPEREVLTRLQHARATWLREQDRDRLGEIAEKLIRVVEELDAARDRAAVTQEEIANRLSEQSNRRLYFLSMVTAVSLPLGLITGLWGSNVGGIPLQHHPSGFVIMGVLMIGLAGALLLALRSKRWL
jgi:zinc transporter